MQPSCSLGRDAALFGRTAAQWWGFDGFTEDVIELVVPRIRKSLDPQRSPAYDETMEHG